MLALFHNFVLGFLSYNIWRRGWDHFVLYGYFVLLPTLYDLTSLRFVRGAFANPAMASPLLCSVGEFDPENVLMMQLRLLFGQLIRKRSSWWSPSLVTRHTALFVICAALRTQKKKYLRHYVNYYNNTLRPNDWKLPNPTDFIGVVKKKMRAFRFIVLV